MKSIKQLPLILALQCLFFSVHCFAQQQSWNWYFGSDAAVNFSTGNPVAVSGSAMYAFEGCASISDSNGHLLFYTNGTEVYNRNNVTMPNGTGLNGASSSTQSGIIVPKPDSGGIYYIFTADYQGNTNGICYSEVDTSLNAGLGDITVKNVQLIHPATEKICAIRHCNGHDFWVIVHEYNDTALVNNSFYAYLVTAAGVQPPVITNIGLNVFWESGGVDVIGYLKASPNGRKLAAANSYDIDTLQLFDFDNSTGILSNCISMPTGAGSQPYGVSFSTNNLVLYVSTEIGGNLFQYDISSNNQATINASQYLVSSTNTNDSYMALQLGVDNKIYVCHGNQAYLDVITSPNVLGSGCNFVTQHVSLTRTNSYGLPNFVDAYYSPPPATSENVNVVSCLPVDSLSPTGTGSSYIWSTGATTESIGVDTAGTYWVHIIGATACNQTINIADTFNVTFAQHPVVNLGPNHSVCGVGPDTLKAGNPGDTYLWSNGATTQNVYITTSGTYHVSVNNGGCTTVDSVTVTFVAAPTINLGPDTSICNNETITLNAGNTGFHFHWNTGATTQTITVDTAGNYFVYVSQGVCHGADTIHVSVLTPPTVNIGPDSTICSNQSVTLNAGNTGSSFLWSTGATTQTISANTSGTYWVQVSNAACSNRDSATITVIPMPVVNLGPDSTLCIGESIIISAGNTGYLYHWSTGATTQTINVTTTGNYSVIVNQGLCAATDTIVLHFINPPVINLGNDTFVCSPNPVTLNAQNNGNSYLWNSGQTTQSITVNNPGTYWVIVNNGSCSRTDSINISVVTPPVLNPQFVADTTKGCNPLTINFTNNSSGGTSYIWKYGDNTALGTSLNVTHTYTDTGVFTVTLTIINDTSTVCGTYIDSLVISHYIAIADPIHITSNFSGSPLSGCTPLIVNFTNRSTNGANYIWNFGNGMSISDTGNVETIYEFAGTYKITLVASNYNDRCYNAPDSMSIDVTVDSCDLYIPNVFSPNGDGRNDNYEFNAEGYANFHLIIFDRWGLKIFESTDNSIKWNGQINNSGSNAPDGTYYYIFNSIDPNGQPYANHGFLTLIR